MGLRPRFKGGGAIVQSFGCFARDASSSLSTFDGNCASAAATINSVVDGVRRKLAISLSLFGGSCFLLIY